MSRHRSPKGRRAYHGPPLSALAAAAGSGGAHRSNVLPSVFPTPMHAVAAVVVGGTLAAAAQQALTTALPAVDDGIAAARASFNSAVAGPAAATVSPVVPEPTVADATSLVKAADLQQAAAKARAQSVAAAAAAASRSGARALAPRLTPRRAVPPAPRPAAAPGGAVRILSGPVTSGFGGRWGTVHQGLDIAAPIGTPIHVPMAGVVVNSGPASGFGMWVRVQHSDGTITVYGHINRSFVQVGQRVAAGQVIAETGNRGQSTGPHLHIGVMQNGVYVNPKPWLDAHGFRY